LSKYFFLLKWSRESSRQAISDVPVPVITAFLSASPHQSLSDFLLDCRIVEHRVVAQAKGLLETYQAPLSMLYSNILDLQRSGLAILSDAASGHVGYRSVSHEADLMKTYQTTCIGWVHRSAYDYILGDHSDYARSWRISVDEPKFLLNLLNAQSWLAHYFLGQHMDPLYSPATRLMDVSNSCAGKLKVAGFEALDKLYDTIEVSYYEGGCIGPDGGLVTGAKLRLLLEGHEPLRTFWIALVYFLQGEYLITRFDRIRSSSHVDIICSGMIHYFWLWISWNAIDASQVECMMPAMTLSFDHLLDQGPMGCVAVVARPIIFFSGDINAFCLSWSGRGRYTERIMVTDILCALTKPKDSRTLSDHDSKRYPETGYFLSARDLGQKLIELADLWQIYCGRRFDVPPFTPLHLYVSARAFKCSYRKKLDRFGRMSSDYAFPNWRFVCLG
jgi:hypothetical protein